MHLRRRTELERVAILGVIQVPKLQVAPQILLPVSIGASWNTFTAQN